MYDLLLSVVMDLPVALLVTLITAAMSYAWKHRATFADLLYVARYQLTRRFKKDSFSEDATLDVKVVGVISSRYDPYSGEWITVKRNAS